MKSVSGGQRTPALHQSSSQVAYRSRWNYFRCIIQLNKYIKVTLRSRPNVFCQKGLLRNFSKFTRNHLCRSLFFNKVAGSVTLFKKRLWHRCFTVNSAKFLIILLLLLTIFTLNFKFKRIH